MIISHQHEFVFTRPLKVGSTTAHAMLLNSDLLGVGDYHSGAAENVADSGFFDIADSLPAGYFDKDDSDMARYSAKARLTHATPSLLYEMGLLTEAQLNEYLFVSIIRDPIERYISAWLFDGGGTYEGFLAKIEKQFLPHSIKISCPKDYFYHQGKKLNRVKVLSTQYLDDSFPSFIKALGGHVVYPKRLKQSTYPAWAKRHYTQWIPLKYLSLLKDLLADEIAFYQQQLGRGGLNENH